MIESHFPTHVTCGFENNKRNVGQEKIQEKSAHKAFAPAKLLGPPPNRMQSGKYGGH